jgi:hypothetical protein
LVALGPGSRKERARVRVAGWVKKEGRGEAQSLVLRTRSRHSSVEQRTLARREKARVWAGQGM